MALAVGNPFPTLPLQSASGPVDLSTRWAQGPLIVAFHRLWCPFCQEAMIRLTAARDELLAAGGDAVVIYREEPGVVGPICGGRGTPFDCLSDPGRHLEGAAMIDRFKARRYAAFSPRRLGQAVRSGGRVTTVPRDLLQGRGTYVVAPDGRVAYTHISQTAADIPSVGELIAAVRAAA